MAAGVEKRGGGASVIVGDAPSRRPAPSRDKTELRAVMQESVYQHTLMLRDRLLPVLRRENPGWTEDQLLAELDRVQPIYEEYDPVVALAMMAADHHHSPELRRQAHAEAAQYVRPKLKSIELRAVDDRDVEEKRALAEKLRGLLDAGATAKRESGSVIEAEAVDVTPRDKEAPDRSGAAHAS